MRGLRVGRAAAWSLTWAVGVAIGVALGAYLSVIGDASAPGTQSLGSTDLVVLPLACGLAVFVISFAGRLVFALAGSTPSRDANESGSDDDQAEDEGVSGVE